MANKRTTITEEKYSKIVASIAKFGTKSARSRHKLGGTTIALINKSKNYEDYRKLRYEMSMKGKFGAKRREQSIKAGHIKPIAITIDAKFDNDSGNIWTDRPRNFTEDDAIASSADKFIKKNSELVIKPSLWQRIKNKLKG